MNNENKKPSKSNPIPESIESVPNYPDKLKIYLVNGSSFYWSRVYLNGAYKMRSLKTTDKKEAIKLAKDFYEEALIAYRTGGHKAPKNRTFVQIGKNFIETLKGTANNRMYKDDLNRYKKELVPYFGERDISLITNAEISGLISKLQAKDLSPATVNHYVIVLRKILKFAVNNQIINSIPIFPKIPGKSKSITKRDYFTLEEYKLLTETADKLALVGTKIRGVLITEEMKFLIQFMVNSFLRPSDLRVLKHKHVSIQVNQDEADEKYNKFLLLSHPATKTTDQEVVTMYGAYFVYEKLKAFHKPLGYANKEDYVFFPNYPNRDSMMNRVGKLFKKIVEDSGVGNKNEKHTLYSLRHSSIMWRLQKGNVNTLQLAKNARTSQAMIEKYYASRLTNLMGVNELHSFKTISKPS